MLLNKVYRMLTIFQLFIGRIELIRIRCQPIGQRQAGRRRTGREVDRKEGSANVLFVNIIGATLKSHQHKWCSFAPAGKLPSVSLRATSPFVGTLYKILK